MSPHAKKIYLDYAASTPVDPRIFDSMEPYFMEKFGNPGSLHSFGQEAVAALDISRETIAKAIGAEFREIVFTGSATEANNLALRGTLRTMRVLTQKKVSDDLRPRIIISAIEHESVLETVRELEKEGAEVVYLPVNKSGIVNFRALEASLNDRTVLVSVMYANNEIGTIQPIAKISEIIRNFRETSDRRQEIIHHSPFTIHHFSRHYPLFHTDAVQAFQFLDCDVKKLGVDMMTLSAHKIYGPKGVGALYVSEKLKIRGDKERKFTIHHSPFTISPIITGGGQEFGMRSGTENVPSIVGFAKAVELRSHFLVRANEQMSELRDYLWRGIKKIAPKAEINGGSPPQSLAVRPSRANHRGIVNRFLFLPNILNVYFPGHEAQDILTRLDLQGIAVSSGSACRARALEPSHVIGALGCSKERAKASVRMSLGRPTTKKEIDRVLAALSVILKNANLHY